MALYFRNISSIFQRFINHVKPPKRLSHATQRSSIITHRSLPPHTYEIASSKDIDPIMNFLDGHYFYDEPLLRGTKLPEHSLQKLRNRYKFYANQGFSVVIKDQHKRVMGVAINRSYPSWIVNRELDVINKLTCRRLQCYYDLLYRVQIRANLFRRINTNYCFHCYLICVHRNYRRKGLSRNLLVKSVEIAKNKHFDLIRVDSTNHYISVMCSNLRMQLAYEMMYRNFTDLYGHYSFRSRIPAPHNCIRVFIEPIECKRTYAY